MSEHIPSAEEGGDAVSRFVCMLRDVRRMPVNFIQADDRIERSAPESGEHLEAVLDGLTMQAPIYRWSKMAGHYVLYPRAAVWDAQISGVQITNVPRLDAGTQFVARVRTMVPELADLSEPPMIGDSRSPVYQQTVSLPHNGSILQHLVALIGPYPQIIFTIERTIFGDRSLHFGQVQE
ncbi:MAG TPA: hypothetical protein VKF84_18240 [Candidatus Sulfotelmatobacter sp.]|nr:hypothetical protein [Candidatus Sulfotelmatobacter sp.]